MNRRPARINPDRLPVLVLAVVLTAALAAVSFTLSFTGLSATAAWASIPAGLAWTVPVTIDGAIVVYTLAVLLKRQRDESARVQWASLAAFTAVSVAANAYHALIAAPSPEVALPGAIVAGLAPVAQLAATHTLVDMVVEVERPAADDAVDELVAYAEADADLTRSLFAAGATAVNEWTRTEPKPSRSKPSPERDALIRERYAELGSVRAVADELGIGKTTVARVIAQPATDSVAVLA